MTLLNDADKIYLGSLEADAVYLGAEKVWPPEAEGPWTPEEITDGMWGWWDPSIAASLTFSGANLLEMADQSPANHKMGRAVSSGPILTSINSLGALQYVAGQGIASVAAQFDDFTVCAVFKPGNTVGDYERVIDHHYVGGWWVGRTGGTQTWGGGVADGPGTNYGVFIALANNEVHQISSRRAGDQHTISGNGGAVMQMHAVTTARTGAMRITIADDQSNLSPLIGVVAEAIVWSRSLPADELAMTEGYLAHKWGIQAKLPADHPYKNTAPGAPGPVGPPVVTGLVHWLDASQLALSDDADVSVWPNLGTGAQPTILTTGGGYPMKLRAGVLNGKDVVQFYVNGWRLRSAFSGANEQNYTLLYVVRWMGPSPGRAFSAQYPPSNFLVGMHTSMRDAMFDNGTWLYGSDNAWAGWTAPGPWRMYEADGVLALDSRFFIDGVRVSTVGPGSGGGLANGWTLSGYDAAGVPETMDMEVAELLLYDHRLTDPERISVEGYLKTKWGLP